MSAMDPAFIDTLIECIAFERVADALAAEGGLPGPVDEVSTAVAVAAASALRRGTKRDGDLYTQRRGPSAVALLFGVEPALLLHQRLGTAKAPAGGRDPGAFPTDLDRGLLSPFDPPGKSMEVMAGATLAFRMRGESRVGLIFDSVEGTASGDWHEGFNFAAVSGAPLVAVIRAGPGDNRPHSALRRFARKAPAYGVQVQTAVAEDPFAVRDVVAGCVQAAREGGGTQLVVVARREPGTDSADLPERLAMTADGFEARVADRVDAFGAFAAEVRAARTADLPTSLGPVVDGRDASTPWYRTAELRSR